MLYRSVCLLICSLIVWPSLALAKPVVAPKQLHKSTVQVHHTAKAKISHKTLTQAHSTANHKLLHKPLPQAHGNTKLKSVHKVLVHKTATLKPAKHIAKSHVIKTKVKHRGKKTSTKREQMITVLLNQLGKPYRWGGTTPRTGFDCSGLIYYAYHKVTRKALPRTANDMYYHSGRPVKRAYLKSGDLVFFHLRDDISADHMGVYLGNGRFIQSPHTGDVVRISSLNNPYWAQHFIGARRILDDNAV